jgi:hypothetical protein
MQGDQHEARCLVHSNLQERCSKASYSRKRKVRGASLFQGVKLRPLPAQDRSGSSLYASLLESGPSSWRTSHSISHSSPWTMRNRRVYSMASSFDFASSIA